MPNKAFLIDYWRKARWILLLIGMILITTLFIPMQRMAEEQKSHGPVSMDASGSVDWLSHPLTVFDPDSWLILTTALLGVVLFIDDRRSATGDLIFSLPVKRQSLFFTKWITGVRVIGLTFLAILGVTSAYYYLFSSWTASPFWVIPQFSLAAGLAHVAIFTLMLLVQTLIGNVMIAGVVACLLLVGSSTITTLVVNFIWFNSGLPYDHPLISRLMGLKYFHFSDLYLPGLAGAEQGGMILSYSSWWANVLILAAVVWLAYRLGSLAYARASAEDNGQLVLFAELMPLIKLGGSLVFGLAIAYWLASPGLGRNVLRLDLLFVLCTAIGYLILNRAIRLGVPTAK